jgi:hypothetical protein
MIGNEFNLSQDAIFRRFEREIPDLEKLVASRLKLKNPGELPRDAETPMPEVLAWAIRTPQCSCIRMHMLSRGGNGADIRIPQPTRP